MINFWQENGFDAFRASQKCTYTRFLCYVSWVAREVIDHFLNSKSKEAPKLLSSLGMRGGKFISVNNVSAQEHASSKTGTF